MEPSERRARIQENLGEVLNSEMVEKIIAESNNPRIYWGRLLRPSRQNSPAASGWLRPTVLLTDINSFLDNLKTPIELVEGRAEFYRYTITAILRAVGVSTEKLKFVLGSSYQRSPQYILDMYRLGSLISKHDAKCWMNSTWMLMFSLEVDSFQPEANELISLFIAAKEWLLKLVYEQSSSDPGYKVHGRARHLVLKVKDSKIDLLEPPEVLSRKIHKAIAIRRVDEGNGVLAFVEHTLLPAVELARTARIPR
ncbi:hypothetical protein GB937_006372 [Aspergillus fischeri]|nr:hypothetical protein GB937_006372 [Aspergillus fischeri]